MKQLDYQEIAIEKLINTSNQLFGLEGNKTIVFKSPTGSGKTIMLAEFLRQFVHFRSDDKSFSFIWAAPRKLHNQSKEKIEKLYEGSRALKCSYFEMLTDRVIGENEILFINWESINQDDNIFIRENEQEFNLENVIERTSDAGRIIVLIIDESHHTAGAENTRELISLINAKLTIEVSATPKIIGDETVTVYREHVIKEEMIKKSIVINPDAENIITGNIPDGLQIESTGKESTNEFIINLAIAKREQLKKQYEQNGSNVNPLILIQLPDRRAGQDMKDEVISFLKDIHNIKIEDESLAIYLSEDKENLSMIEKNDSPVKVMIFKQAIALGWDCPRASILVLFRDWKSIVFSIQTVGRIMRMPELKHYPNEELNTGFVYTNLSDISIHQDIADGYASIHYSTRKESYIDINLNSVHSKRQREKTRLAPKYLKHFAMSAEELKLEENIDYNLEAVKSKFITDGVITNIDDEFDHLNDKNTLSTHKTSLVERILNEEEIQKRFDDFIIEALSPIHPESRSVGRIKDAVYKFLLTAKPVTFEYGGINSQLVVLNEKNTKAFLDVINHSKQTYLEEVEKIEKELVNDENWEIPSSLSFSNEYEKIPSELSIMHPFFRKKSSSNPEKDFQIYLESKALEIEWWFKNGERDGTYFAVPYVMNDESLPFYVDWIVKYKDDRIGLFDTKAGLTAKDAKEKAEGLAKYISGENSKGKNLFGGIVIIKNGSVWLNDKEEYQYDENRLSELGWEII